MNAIQKKRNQKVIAALKANKKKAMNEMRNKNGNRCCLCVAEDAAILDGLNIPKCSLDANFPRNETQDYLGWNDNDPSLVVLPGKSRFFASEINDSKVGIPHSVIAEFFANTFTRKRARLTPKACKFAEKFYTEKSGPEKSIW